MSYELELIDLYWRAANYFTIAFMYLDDNFFLANELSESSLSKFVSGHWGTCPGVNFIYAHLNNFTIKYKRRIQLTIGAGHAGCALISNLFLENSIEEYYSVLKNLTVEEKCIKIKQKIKEMRTEISPFYPGTIYDGGELGYSLPVSYGTIINEPDLINVCVFGDGESETGTLSASLLCCNIMNQQTGLVLPILNLNGYKMGSRSLLAKKTDQDLISMYSSFGFEPKIINANHQEMYLALDWVEEQFQKIKHGENVLFPMLILKSPKGWTAPSFNGIEIEGKILSHKDPLGNIDDIKVKKQYIEYWLKSYIPKDLFDNNGDLSPKLKQSIPIPCYRIGKSLDFYKYKELEFPDINKFYTNSKVYPNIVILKNYLYSLIKYNPDRFLLVSPDELSSNKLGDLLVNNNIVEVLNENICQAIMQGYIMTGKNCVMIGYEAFMPIITSMIHQCCKWLYQCQKISWRKPRASFTYILTSVCWANTYSHQNPSLINDIIESQYPFVRVYFPPDANSLLLCVDKALKSKNKINIIITSKQPMKQWFSPKIAFKNISSDLYQWDCKEKSLTRDPELIIVAVGDYLIYEAKKAIEILNEYFPFCNIRFISVHEITRLGSPQIYENALTNEEFNNYFTQNVPIVFCFHGYPSVIKSLLFDRISKGRMCVLGYNNKSYYSTNSLNKLLVNNCSRYDIALCSAKRLFKSGSISENEFNSITIRLNTIINNLEKPYNLPC